MKRLASAKENQEFPLLYFVRALLDEPWIWLNLDLAWRNLGLTIVFSCTGPTSTRRRAAWLLINKSCYYSAARSTEARRALIRPMRALLTGTV